MSSQPEPSSEVVHHPGNTHNFVRAGILSLLLLVLALGIGLYRQLIIDQVTVWGFTPTSEVVEAANRSGMNDTGKFYVFASRSGILDRTAFNSACGSAQSEQSVVIGCYTLPEKQIHVFGVTDERLDGAVEVTLAHEMLHAAYDRLSDDEKEWLKGLLEAEANKTTDKRLLELIDNYKKTEPGEIINELHSIFGTEVDALSSELENYYARYFRDRTIVVGLKNGYEHVFTELRSKQEALVKEMNELSDSITERRENYDITLATLNADIEAFNAWNQSGVARLSEFTARRTTLEQRIAAATAEQKSISQAIEEYTSMQAELEALNLQVQGLNASINSKLQPAPSL